MDGALNVQEHSEDAPNDREDKHNELQEESETPAAPLPDVSNLFKFDFQSLQDLMQGFQEKIDGQAKKVKQLQAQTQLKSKQQAKDVGRALRKLEANVEKTSERLEAHKQKAKKFNEAVGQKLKAVRTE